MTDEQTETETDLQEERDLEAEHRAAVAKIAAASYGNSGKFHTTAVTLERADA